MLIKVTPRNIRMGYPGNTCRCAVSLAIREAAQIPPGEGDVRVGEDYIYVHHKQYATPEDVRHFVRMYDGRYAVEPIQFHLDIPVYTPRPERPVAPSVVAPAAVA